MSRRCRPAATAGAQPRCTATICRGGRCGTAKIPGLDHGAQLAHLRRSLAEVAQVRVSGCLNICEHAEVVVIQPSVAGRAAGGRPAWLGLVNDADAGEDIAAWVRVGGPGIADPLGVLDLYAFTPSHRVRQALS